jgi:hypothetical protein
LSNDLKQLGPRLGRKFGDRGAAPVAILVAHFDLDKLVELERGVDFNEHGFGQSRLAQQDHGFEFVRPAA